MLHVIARMNIGGPAVEITTLMQKADSSNIEQLLVTGYCQSGEAECDALEELLESGTALRIDSLGRLVRPWDDLKAIAQLIKVIRSFRPDVIHTHTAKAGVIGRIAATPFRPHVKVVHTYHGHLLSGYFAKWKTRAWIVVERLLAARTDVLVSVGEAVRSDLLAEGIGISCDFRVINSGLTELTLVNQKLARTALGLDDSSIVIAYVGRLAQIKRPDRLLEVVKLISAESDETEFLVAGAGELSEWFNDQCQLQALPVKSIGWTDDVSLVYSASDIVLLTSDNEGVPLTLIEAAMAGLPVVSTDVGSVSEIVLDGETGLLTPRTANALALSLQTLINDQDLRISMGIAAERSVGQRFPLTKFVETHVSLYQELAG